MFFLPSRFPSSFLERKTHLGLKVLLSDDREGPPIFFFFFQSSKSDRQTYYKYKKVEFDEEGKRQKEKSLFLFIAEASDKHAFKILFWKLERFWFSCQTSKQTGKKKKKRKGKINIT